MGQKKFAFDKGLMYNSFKLLICLGSGGFIALAFNRAFTNISNSPSHVNTFDKVFFASLNFPLHKAFNLFPLRNLKEIFDT
jgi:hypothetical protein